MNTLIPAAPGSRSSSASSATFSCVPPTQNAKSQAMRPRRARELVLQRGGVGGLRVGVGHFEHRRHAAHDGGAGARSRGPPCAPGPARENAPGCRSRPAGCAGRGNRRARSAAAPERSPISAMRPSRHANVAHADAVVIDDRSAREHAIEAQHGATSLPAAGNRPTSRPEPSGSANVTETAVFLKDRGVVRVAGADAASFLQGLLTNDVEKLPDGGAALRRAVEPAGQDPVRSPRPPPQRRGIPARRARRQGGGTGETARLLQAARQGRSRRRQRRFRRRRRAAGRARRPARAGARPPRRSSPRATRPRADEAARAAYEARRIALGVAAGRARFRLWRRLPARRQHGPAARRRFHQGLLCRPGGGLAHEAHAAKRASASRASRSTAPRRRRARRCSTASCRWACSAAPRAARRWRCCGSTAAEEAARGGRALTAAGTRVTLV